MAAATNTAATASIDGLTTRSSLINNGDTTTLTARLVATIGELLQTLLAMKAMLAEVDQYLC